MGLWQKIKNLFRKEVGYLFDAELNSIFDHPKVSFDKSEYERIKDSLRIYAGEYKPIEYVNSKGKSVKRDFMHLNMMKEVAKLLSSVLFNEQCVIKVDDSAEDNSKANSLQGADDFIQHVFGHNKFKKNFAKYLEPMLAAGGLAVRPYYDATTGEIEFSWCMPDTFIPLHSNTNAISECVISSKTTKTEDKKTIYYTLLEFHEWTVEGYTITNELYRSEDNKKIGKRVRLSELYPDLPEVSKHNLTRPNFAYVKPYGFNNINPSSPLGLGVCDNAKNTLKQINTVYDQFYWELKQSKRRLIVSDHYLKTNIDSQGNQIQYFDDETDVFVALRGEIDDMTYKDMTTEIRSSQYIESINKFFTTLEMQIGLSAGTFTFDKEGMKTATEVISRDSTTYRTRNSHIVEISDFMKSVVISVLELAKETVGRDGKRLYTGVIPSEEQISVDFDDGMFNDRATELDFWTKVKMSGFAPDEIAIQRLFGLTEEQAQEWVSKIRQEKLLIDPHEQEKRAESSLLGDEE
ncbi:phage portal protein [Aerococcaceae bacterium NML160702]|nr:phage portal protein [Aerococcaceae bacterium NML160702]